MFARLIALLAVLAVAVAQQWSLDSSTTATFVTSVSAASESFAVTVGGQNGGGSILETYDGSSWSKNKVPTLMALATATTPSGNIVVTSINSVLNSNDGVNFSPANAAGTSQSANVYGDNKEKFALVGYWRLDSDGTSLPTYVYGVASSDDGKSFAVSSNIEDGYSRYGAFPSDNTWYVSNGMWGADPTPSKAVRMLSSRVAVDGNGNRVLLEDLPRPLKRRVSDNSTGWFGSVSKTTDAGKTWTQVLTTNLAEDYIYFNEISCSSETNCIVVGEGDGANGGYLTVAYTTFDGGATWEKTFSSADFVSLMSVKFVSSTDAWLLATQKSGRNLVGNFFKTTDGGKTFTLSSTLNNCFGMDMSFAGNLGLAACCSSSGSSCSIAVYK
jgi:hypothetical protein|eukprot:gene13161-9428_t